MNVPAKVSSFFRPLYEFVFPRVCFACELPLQNGEWKVCARCWSTIQRSSPEDAFFREMHARVTSFGHISGLVSPFYFEKEGVLQSLLHQLKYGGMTVLGVELGKRLGESVRTQLGRTVGYGLIPVPLHPARARERGYNQCEYLCKGVREVTGFEIHSSVLTRRKFTVTQTELTIEKRRENVEEAFAVNRSLQSVLRDGEFLLVDDVITTGATVNACAKVLMNHGARRVIACSVGLAK